MKCPYICDNKTEYGYCKTTGCINPKYGSLCNSMTEDYYNGFKDGFESGYRTAREVFEPKRGRWINKFVCSNNHICSWCSECRKLFYNIPTEDGEYNYCPNCGMKMSGE